MNFKTYYQHQLNESLNPESVVDFYTLDYIINFGKTKSIREWAQHQINDYKKLIWKGLMADLIYAIINEAIWVLKLKFRLLDDVVDLQKVKPENEQEKWEVKTLLPALLQIQESFGGLGNYQDKKFSDCVKKIEKQTKIFTNFDMFVNTIKKLKPQFDQSWWPTLNLFFELHDKGFNNLSTQDIDQAINLTHRAGDKLVNHYFAHGPELLKTFDRVSSANTPKEYTHLMGDYIKTKFLQLN